MRNLVLNNFCENNLTMCSLAIYLSKPVLKKKHIQLESKLNYLETWNLNPLSQPHWPPLRLAYSIGSGYTSVKHARMVGEVYDSDLLRYLVCTMECDFYYCYCVYTCVPWMVCVSCYLNVCTQLVRSIRILVWGRIENMVFMSALSRMVFRCLVPFHGWPYRSGIVWMIAPFG